jgi:hypothetical protein
MRGRQRAMGRVTAQLGGASRARESRLWTPAIVASAMSRRKRVCAASPRCTARAGHVLIAAAALVAGLAAQIAVTTAAEAGFPVTNGPIAFVSDRDSPRPEINDDIYVTDEMGAPAMRLTSDPGFDDFPAVSPNGKEIVFASTRSTSEFPNPEGDLELYVMDIADDDGDHEGDNLRRLTDNAAPTPVQHGRRAGRRSHSAALKTATATSMSSTPRTQPNWSISPTSHQPSMANRPSRPTGP